eukprot:COSAG01_NODE_38209_length_492_cov_3.620865_1_plen_86_part_01
MRICTGSKKVRGARKPQAAADSIMKELKATTGNSKRPREEEMESTSRKSMRASGVSTADQPETATVADAEETSPTELPEAVTQEPA